LPTFSLTSAASRPKSRTRCDPVASSAYYFLCPTASAEEPKIAAFRRWLIAEAAKAGDWASI